MREIRTSGSMSGEGKRDDAAGPQVTAPLLDSTAQQSEIVRRTKKGAPSHALGCIWECDLPNGSLHDPDGPEADGQKEYRGGNCKTDLFAHESLEPVSDKLKSRTVHEGRHEKLCRRGRPPG